MGLQNLWKPGNLALRTEAVLIRENFRSRANEEIRGNKVKIRAQMKWQAFFAFQFAKFEVRKILSISDKKSERLGKFREKWAKFGTLAGDSDNLRVG